jgi:hypothetical protein
MKRLLWTTLVTLASAAAAGAAARLVDRLWRWIAKAEPPAIPRWARFLVAGRLHARIRQHLYPAAP